MEGCCGRLHAAPGYTVRPQGQGKLRCAVCSSPSWPSSSSAWAASPRSDCCGGEHTTGPSGRLLAEQQPHPGLRRSVPGRPGLPGALLQRGSPESKELHKAGPESDRDQRVGEHARENSPLWAGTRDRRQNLYSRSLGVVMALLFVLSWLAQSISGAAACNAEQLRDLSEPVSWAAYPASADFWSRTLQNWQSELLAVASMAVLSVHLRQRGSPESKPVGAPHSATGVEG
ncbi:DUF6766 family protein [Streptomyces hydrogenans]